jgi:hypothetical protein
MVELVELPEETPRDRVIPLLLHSADELVDRFACPVTGTGELRLERGSLLTRHRWRPLSKEVRPFESVKASLILSTSSCRCRSILSTAPSVR